MAVIDLASRGPITLTAHALADYLLSTPTAQRRILNEHLFPDDSKAKIIQRQPARELAAKYFLSEHDPTIIHDAVLAARRAPPSETPHARARREAILDVADHLSEIAAKFPVSNAERSRLKVPVSGLLLKASVDILATGSHGKRIALSFNATRVTSSNAERRKHFAKIHCEVAFRAYRYHRQDIDEAWYIDLCSGERIKRQVSPSDNNWRNIEIACDRIAIEMRELLRRRRRLDSAGEI